MEPFYITLIVIIIAVIVYFIYSYYKKQNARCEELQTIYTTDENWTFCFNTLKEVSRSFNIVIQQLNAEEKNVVCIFYLVLRGLDTVEDDMTIPVETKKPMLLSFYNDIENDDFTLDCGDKPEYKNLMTNFNKVNKCYKQLKPKYQVIIKEITNKMAHGMVEFLDKKGLTTSEEYDLYCYYVAGLVGVGLSQIFAKSGNESKNLLQYDKLSIAMGTFLQKTNIIRDIKEDIDESRAWWPTDKIKDYVDSHQELLREDKEEKSLECLNSLIINAMSHIPQCVEYLSLIDDDKHFRFCAIPQVVAIQTLATLFNNKNVFKRTEKLNKTIVARIFMNVNDMESALAFYIDALEKIETKIQNEKISTINRKDLETLEKIKGFLVKYVIELSNKSKSKMGGSREKKGSFNLWALKDLILNMF
jgi:farnesyl-diphosphate farnesyltransferase